VTTEAPPAETPASSGLVRRLLGALPTAGRSAGVRVTVEVRRLIRGADRARDARDWSTAALRYGEALERNPGLAHIWVQLGHALKEGGSINEATEAYRRAIELVPQDAETHLHLAHALKRGGRSIEAAEHFMRALEIDASLTEAQVELGRLAERGAPIDRERLADARRTAADEGAPKRPRLDALTRNALHDAIRALEGGGGQADVEPLRKLLALADARQPEATGAGVRMVFDASDLFQHFRAARLPTGIQRVQMEILSALFAGPDPNADARLAYFPGGAANHWVEAPVEVFLEICRLSRAAGDADDPCWTREVHRLEASLAQAPRLWFAQGDFLINLGASWFDNYLLSVREAKREAQIRYVPFIHDLIPFIRPETCQRPLVEAATKWTAGAFAHADLFLANSESTRRDLVRVAADFGYEIAPERVAVVPLDADIRNPETQTLDARALGLWGLSAGGFVLFVSTFEPRKNHVGAFAAWSELIRTHGARKVPQLVCVGGRVGVNEAPLALLAADPELNRKVTQLWGASEAELALLYRTCAFTLYPSHYEGWGLPVTEGLCFGRTAVVSDAASLPEVGGAFVEYFESGSTSGLVAALERMLFEPGYRAARERKVRAEFRPRPWLALATQIEAQLTRWRPDAAASRDGVPRLSLGAYYALGSAAGASGRAAVAESLRAGDSWWTPEPWGCWTNGRPAALAFRNPAPERLLRAYVGVRGLPDRPSRFRVEGCGAGAVEGRLAADAERWVMLLIPAGADPDGEMRITVSGDTYADLQTASDGQDHRILGLGVVGLMICADDDLRVRADFIEAVTLGQLEALA
jgi:glycosyltransferase involved in cell wall biosynthesis